MKTTPRDHPRTPAPPQVASATHSLSGANAQSPSHLTATERLDEVARILAAGILRARAQRLESQAQSTGKKRECSLDLPLEESGHVHTKTRRGENK